MLTFEQEQKAIKDAISRFPKFFNLRGCAHTVRISEQSSFFSGPVLYLYTEVEIDGKWMSYAKGTEAELKAAYWPMPDKAYDPLFDANARH